MGDEKKEPRSFRLTRSLVDDLEQRAHSAGSSVTALVERYLAEGLRRDQHPLIAFREGAGGRRASLVGTRLDVSRVIETVRESESPREAAEYLGITEAQVRAAVRYYTHFEDEIDAWAERMHDTAEREREAWEREQSLLA